MENDSELTVLFTVKSLFLYRRMIYSFSKTDRISFRIRELGENLIDRQ